MVVVKGHWFKRVQIFHRKLYSWCLRWVRWGRWACNHKSVVLSKSVKKQGTSHAVAVISAFRISFSSWSFDLFAGKDLSCAWEVHENTEGQAPFFNFLFRLADEIKSPGIKWSEQTFILSVTLKSFFGSLFIRVIQTLKTTTNYVASWVNTVNELGYHSTHWNISVDCSDISYLYELFILREAVKWEILISWVIFTIVSTAVMNHGFQK